MIPVSLPIAPRVPPELWLKIFDLATDTPSLLDCSPPLSDLPPFFTKHQDILLLKESLTTKLSIGLVCRSWHEIGTELLYKIILITRMGALSSLGKTLHRRASGRLRHNPGWWTRRLDVIIEDDHCEAADYEVLAEVIRHFSNLSIVSLSLPMPSLSERRWLGHLPTEVIISFVETCGPSLSIFDCSESILCPCREDLMVLLAGSPNLRVLRCPACSPTPGNRSPTTRLDVPLMEKLESITLMSVFLRHYLPRDRHSNRLPALRQLTYGCTRQPFIDHAWKNFVKLSCSAVISVTLDLCYQGGSLQKELDILAECCPALDKLVIYFHSWAEFTPHLIIPPVSRLRIFSNLIPAPALHYQYLVVALATLKAPRLESVQILQAHAAEEFRRNLCSLPVDDLVCLASRAFRVQDHDGYELLAAKSGGR